MSDDGHIDHHHEDDDGEPDVDGMSIAEIEEHIRSVKDEHPTTAAILQLSLDRNFALYQLADNMEQFLEAYLDDHGEEPQIPS